MEEISKHIVIKTFRERKEKGEFTGKYSPQDNKNKTDKRVGIRLF